MPTLVPLIDAPLAVQIHVACALAAIGLLPLTLFRRRRDRLHRMSGYVWVAAMVTTALSSFFIHGVGGIGPFSPIHLISLYALFGIWQAVRAAIRKDIAAHKAAMTGLTVGALGVAGVLSFMPGRRMNAMLFGDASQEGFFLILALAVIGFGVALSRRKQSGFRRKEC